jgi:hypothetical protein
MCFHFVKSKRSGAKNGIKADKTDLKAVKPGLEVNENKPEKPRNLTKKSAGLETPLDDKPARDRKANLIPIQRKRPEPLSSTPKDDQSFITEMVQKQTLEDLFKRMLYQGSNSLKLDERLWTWRMTVKERVETLPTEELTNQYRKNLQQLVEELSKVVSTASAVQMISKAANKSSNYDANHVSKQMLAKNNLILRSLNSVIVRQTRDRFWAMFEGQTIPLRVKNELSELVLASSRLEDNLPKNGSPCLSNYVNN